MKFRGSYEVQQWHAEVIQVMGTKQFRLRDLPEHLQSRSCIMKARQLGLVARSGCTLKGNNGQGVYLWKVKA